MRLSARLAAGLAARIGRGLVGGGESGGSVAEGETCTGPDTALVIEVLAGAGRPGVLTGDRRALAGTVLPRPRTERLAPAEGWQVVSITPHFGKEA